MTNKITYVSALNAVIEGKELTPEIIEKLTALRDAQAKRNGAERKPTKTQTENDGYKVAILGGMADDHLYTITDLIKAIPEIADLSNQRVSAIVRQLKDEGAVERVEEKRKAYFRKVSE